MENASKALIIAGAILISILLITIGIILINSGRDITDTGVSGMQSQKIQTFNSQFTAYEGTRKGSEIRSLANVINASNATDSEHQVRLTATGNGATNVNSLGDIVSSKNYTVTVYYATDDKGDWGNGKKLIQPQQNTEKGYIYRIDISVE